MKTRVGVFRIAAMGRVGVLTLTVLGATLIGVAPTAGAAVARVTVDGATALPLGSTPVATAPTADFDVVLTPHDAGSLRDLVAAVDSPASPQYRHFLTEPQYVARFAPRWAVVDRVAHYFRSFGLTVQYQRDAPLELRVAGPTADIEHAFAAKVRSASNGGHRFTAFAQTATLPSSVARAVSAVAGLSTLAPLVDSRTTARSVHAHLTEPSTCSGADEYQSVGDPHAFTAQQQASAYGLSNAWTAGYNGAGETIAVYELANFVSSDVNTYFSCYGLSPSLSVVNVDGGPQGIDNSGGTDGPEGEADLDIEEAGVLAPGASLIVYQGTQVAANGVLDTYQAIATDDQAAVVTTSWGGCEGLEQSKADVTAENLVFEQMAAQGQTVLAAAGDSGSSDCYQSNQPNPVTRLAVDDPASQPLVTGVGALTVHRLASQDPPRTLEESVWDDDGGAGGGGKSAFWSQPSWQTGDDAPLTGDRMVPDLSVMGDPLTGFIEYTGGSWNPIGGTSIGAPIMAAVVATADESCGTRLGSINPTLYLMAANGTGFDDVTSGTNSLAAQYPSTFAAESGDYNAAVGYDMASGLGSPDPSTFIPGLCASSASAATSTVTLSPAESSYDVALGATVTVTANDAAGQPIKGLSPVVTATEAGATPHVTALSSPTTSAGIATYAVDTAVPGQVTITATAGDVTLGSQTVTFASSVTATAEGLTSLLALGGHAAAANVSSGTAFGAAVTAAGTVEQETGSGAVTNDTARFRLHAASGAPAVACAAGRCDIALDIAGSIEVINDANGASPTATDLGVSSALARGTAGSTVALFSGASYTDAAWLSNTDQLIVATWGTRPTGVHFTNLATTLHVPKGGAAPSLVATSASQLYLAVRASANVWLVRWGAIRGATNEVKALGYDSARANELTGVPVLARDPDTADLIVLSRTSGGGLVELIVAEPTTLTVPAYQVIATSGVASAAWVAGTVGATAAPDDVLFVSGGAPKLAVRGPQWTTLSVNSLTDQSLTASGVLSGGAPLLATTTGAYAVAP